MTDADSSEGTRREDCWFCGETITAPSASELNKALVQHGVRKHQHELDSERGREGAWDPITVSDLIRSGPNEE